MPVNFTGSYTQNFDTLANTPINTDLPWTNEVTLPGWSLFNRNNSAITSYRADNGSSTSGSFYSFSPATGTTTDRALGGLGSGGPYFGSPVNGAVAGWIAFSATNTTGATINSLNVAFDGEQWRNGGNTTAQAMTLEYGFGSSFTTVSTWTAPGSTFDWTSPIAIATIIAVNGNTTGQVANRGGTLSGLNWANNDTLWFRWVENNDLGNDHGLAIDNFSINAPAPATPTVTIAATDANANETAGNTGTFRISRTGDTTNALTVNYTVSGTATNGTDYSNLTGSATIAAGQTFVDVTITPVDDATVEGNETVTLTLTDTAAYDLGATTEATVAIADNDATISSLTLIGSGTLADTAVPNEFRDLSGITYNAANNTYLVVSDIESNPRFYTVQIAIDAAGSTVTPTHLNGTETPTALTISGGFSNPDMEGIALDNSGNIFVSSEGYYTGGSLFQPDNYVIAENPFIKRFTTTGTELLTLTLPGKFTTSSTTVGPRNNGALESLTLTPSNNYLFTAVEAPLKQDQSLAALQANAQPLDRIVRFDLSGGVSVNAPSQEFLYIGDSGYGLTELLALDNSGQRLLSIERAANPLTQAITGVRVFEVSLAGATDISSNNGLGGNTTGITSASKTLLADFSTPALSSLLANYEGVTFGAPLPDGRRSLVLVSDNGGSGATRFTAFAINETTNMVTIAAQDAAAAEAGQDPGTFRITRTGDTTNALTVNYTVSGTATNGTDYNNLGGTATIAAGESFVNITITPVDDTAIEPGETVILTLTDTADYDLGASSSAEVAIADNDTNPTPSVIISEVAPWSSGNSPGVLADWFEVTNTSTTAVDITGWKMDDSSNSFASSVALSGVTSIAAGQSAIFIEGDATKVTAFVNTWFGGTLPTGVLIGTYSGSGVGLGTAGDAVNLFNASGALVTGVTFGTSPSASPFATFDNTAGGAMVSTLSAVGVNGAFSINDGGVTLIGSPGTIVNSTLPLITIAAQDAAAAEAGQDPGTFRINRTGATTSALTVNYTVSGTATNGTDYNNLGGSATIAAGQSFVDVTITPVDDAAIEGNETVTLTLTDTANYDLGATTSAEVTIADNDFNTVTIAATDANAGEIGGNTGTFRITRTGDTTNALTVNYTIGGTATNVTDYNNLGGSATIAAGQSFVDITVTPVADANVEGNETVTLTLSSSANYTLGTTSAATVTIAEIYQLQLLSYYGESGLLGVETAPIMGALIDRFDDQYVNTLVLGEGDSYIPGPWLIGGADPSLNSVPGIGSTALGRPDIAIMNAFGTDASALGNHEFDLGSPVLQGAIQAGGAWVGAQFPLITANLDFTADASLRGLADATLGGNAANNFAGREASTIRGRIAPYAVVTQSGERIGIVGATTFELLSKTSPNGTIPKDDGNPATSDLQEVAAYIQAAVNALIAQGVNKIVMVDQLDTIERNKALAPLLTGVDVMVAGGGHERMGDANDIAVGFNGHTADFIPDAFPIVTAGADGKPTLIITTDTEYTYLGRLVVDFDGNGEIIVGNLDPVINGAYASTEAILQAAYGTTNTAAQIIASSTIGSQVKAITDAINNVVTSKDGTIWGYTNVYLEGDRAFGRVQEVNLGNITADANLYAAQQALGGGFITSLKNGGGLRASIGSIDEDGSKIAPIANPAVGKAAGGISTLDIENALRFDNKLMVFDTTPQGLKNIMEFAAGLSSGPSQQNGGYMQIGGIRVSYDSTRPTGSKVQSIALTDLNGNITQVVYGNGAFFPTAPATIQMVALNFTANGGDGYPIKTNGTNFRYLLNDGTLSGPISTALDFTAAANVPANALGEQKAFQTYLQTFHSTPTTAYGIADTPTTQDQRIQQLSVRQDTVLLAPTDIALGNSTIAENSSNGSMVGTLTATDPNSTTGFTFSLTDDANGRFAISNNQLVVANGNLLDNAINPNHQVTVRVTDATGAFYDESFTIAVTDRVNPASKVDFNKDGNTDILWRNVYSGDVALWALDGTNLAYAQAIDTVPISSGWEPVSAGDFTGDGNSDVLWRNRYSGENVLWEMNGAAIANAYAIHPTIPVESGWEVVAVGDFTNDNKADILWRNYYTGDNSFWEMDGASFVKGVVLPFEDANSSWDVAGVGDFTSDGNTDILWRNMQTGQNRYWEMQGATMIQEHYIDSMPVEYRWSIAAVGDFSKDGKADILWHNNGGGQLVTWEMSNGVLIGSQQLFPDTPPSTGWTIV